MEHHR
jgi:putative transposase